MGLLKAIFNEKELPIMITKVNRNITPSFTNETVSIGSAKGEIFQYNVYKSKQIEISYQIYNRRAEYLVNFRRGLSALIYTDEPKKLIFSDEPNIYYNAILDGEQTLEEEEYKSSGILRFLIPDGVAHSVAEKTAENYGSNQITLENNGTESVPINIKTTMKSDNGNRKRQTESIMRSR